MTRMRAPMLVVMMSLSGLACAVQEEAPVDDATIEFFNSGQILPATLPFSEAVQVGNLLILSGQIGNVPGKLELVPGGMEAEARQTMENIRTTLASRGLTMRDVIKCTVFLTDMAEWPAFNDVYRTFFEPPFPARSALGTNGLAIGARVEVECIAAVGPRTQ
jgi:2-iminobutanoate/2-iminopropanoate deaminase